MPTVRNSSNFRNGLKQLPTSSNLIFPKEWSNLRNSKNSVLSNVIFEAIYSELQFQITHAKNTTGVTNRSECLILIAEIPKEPSSISEADGRQAEELCSTINLCTCSKKLKWSLVYSLDRLPLLLCVSYFPFCGIYWC